MFLFSTIFRQFWDVVCKQLAINLAIKYAIWISIINIFRRSSSTGWWCKISKVFSVTSDKNNTRTSNEKKCRLFELKTQRDSSWLNIDWNSDRSWPNIDSFFQLAFVFSISVLPCICMVILLYMPRPSQSQCETWFGKV